MKRRNALMAVCATALTILSCGHRHDTNQAMNGDDDGEIVTFVAVEAVSVDTTLTDSTAPPPAAKTADTAHVHVVEP